MGGHVPDRRTDDQRGDSRHRGVADDRTDRASAGPIAALGFAVASWTGIAAQSGTPTVLMMGGLFVLFLALLLLRLTAFDLVQAGKRAKMESETLLARRLVREYENQGTGWFWETDREAA